MIKRLLFFTVFLGCFCGKLTATHNRAGEITYVHLGGTKYGFTVSTCTKTSSPADRPELEIVWGDGTVDTIPRIQVIPAGSGLDAQQNLYYGEHVYPGPGTYVIEIYDPNRNGGVINIANSVNEPFCIISTLVISPFFTPNNSVQLADCPCPEFGCVGQPYCYNVAASDADGDSLSFELVPCRGGSNCAFMAIPFTYQYPNAFGGSINLDPVSGTFCWTSPQIQGEYNIAIIIHEWRKVGPGQYFEMGSVTRDMQITIVGNCNNNTPVLTALPDTCIVAGTTLSLNITATDADAIDDLDLLAAGQPFAFTNSPATFSTVGNNPVNGVFNWNTNCSHIANTAYLVTFSVEDNGGNSAQQPGGPYLLSDYETMLIRVVPPPVQNVTATPQGNTIVVAWTTTACTNADGYKIYRSNTSTPFSGSCCTGSTPLDMGYQLVGTVSNINDGDFIDNTGLVLGEQYCYLVVLYFDDGSVSCPSAQVCTQLEAEFPIITNVSISITDLSLGQDTVRWVHPYQLDTVTQWNGDYYYEVWRANTFTGAATLRYTTPVEANMFQLENEYIDNGPGLNTDGQQYTYFIAMYHIDGANDTALIGNSNRATSVFLTLTPNDNQIGLSWNENVPWVNYLYEVWKETFPGSGIWNLLDTTSQTQYADTGLTNGVTYCYKIRSIGTYTAPQIPTPLFNWSQEECADPIDLTAPCPPVLEIVNDCTTDNNVLTWNNPNNSCADDVMQYNVYYSETDTGQFVLIAQFFSAGDTILLHNNDSSLAGCYYVTAVDSVQYGNESLPSDTVCGDNCPEYTLPNVFSPNGDGENDFFRPFPYNFVKDINIQIFDRWGVLMFQSTDPDIMWNGTYQENGKPCTEGVYYYMCTVNTIRLQGIVPVQLNGFVHLFGKASGSKN